MTLVWRRVDAYCLRSSCGRFSVAKVFEGLTLWYEAYRTEGWDADDKRGESREMLGATRLPITASNDERKRAGDDMKALCEAEAGVSCPPTVNTETAA